jgi:MoaA/NifB/PqqE/SkfB family radical SAM enzyme
MVAESLVIDVPAAQAAVAGHTPGTVAWMRALLDWFESQTWDDAPAAAFAALLRECGIEAKDVTLTGPGGATRSVVEAHLGAGSETTQGWAVVDPQHGQIFTSPDGLMARRQELRNCPDWVAAERREAGEHGDADVEDWMFWAPGPRAINFQIGDICNMHCIMCWHDLRRKDQPRDQWYPEVSAATIRDVLTQHLNDIDHVELVSYGEPMANPEFDEIVHMIGELGYRRKRPFSLNIITNGSLLHKRRHVNVVRQPGYLTFSIDAADEQLYEQIRDGGDWHDVVGNLRTAVRHPERHPKRYIGINMTVFEPNVDNVFAMGAFAAGLGLDYLSILHGTGLHATRAKGMEIDRQDPRLVEQLERIRRTFPWLQLNDYATGRTLPALPKQTLPGREFCPLPWRQFDVGQDGRAHPCCRSFSTDLGSAAEAWTGEPLSTLRRQILDGHVDAERFPVCAACPNLGFENPEGTPRHVIPLRAV